MSPALQLAVWDVIYQHDWKKDSSARQAFEDFLAADDEHLALLRYAVGLPETTPQLRADLVALMLEL